MTKKLTTLTDQDTELDLSNPEVAKMIVANDVTNREVSREGPQPSTPELPTGKTTTFTLRLQTSDVAQLIRAAEASNKSWKQYLTERIQEDILTAKVGRAVISQPSTMSKRISGNTNSVRRG